MRKIFRNAFVSFERKTQISESHCGPAVVQMLLSHIKIRATQKAITEAAGLTGIISGNGMRVDQMETAIKKLGLDAQLWYKMPATLEDIQTIITVYHYPVAVQWQGLFTEDEEESDENTGHYSIVTGIDVATQELIIVDPYKDFSGVDRRIKVSTFLKRWWDVNDVPFGKRVIKSIHDDELLFIVTPKDVSLPESLGLMPGQRYYAEFR